MRGFDCSVSLLYLGRHVGINGNKDFMVITRIGPGLEYFDLDKWS